MGVQGTISNSRYIISDIHCALYLSCKWKVDLMLGFELNV